MLLTLLICAICIMGSLVFRKWRQWMVGCVFDYTKPCMLMISTICWYSFFYTIYWLLKYRRTFKILRLILMQLLFFYKILGIEWSRQCFALKFFLYQIIMHEFILTKSKFSNHICDFKALKLVILSSVLYASNFNMRSLAASSLH